MNKSLVTELHYLGSLEHFSLLIQQEKIVFEICDTFKKQTFRNRTYFLGSNKKLQLNIPLSFSNGTKTKDVKIDYNHKWIKDHWGAFYSSYGKAPFFEYFCDDFKAIWDSKPIYLIDLNQSFFRLSLKILKTDLKIEFTSEYKKEYEMDFRDHINPKTSFTDRKIYEPVKYTQLFGDTFVPNLSIIDLLMSEGPQSIDVLRKSYLKSD
ncbi:MAG: WbqC family protein [Ekhidna sp.]